MTTYKLHRREKIRVERPDNESRAEICIKDARGRAMLVVHNLLIDEKLSPGDIMTVDVRILVERN